MKQIQELKLENGIIFRRHFYLTPLFLLSGVCHYTRYSLVTRDKLESFYFL